MKLFNLMFKRDHFQYRAVSGHHNGTPFDKNQNVICTFPGLEKINWNKSIAKS